jgi:hypothetical protein
MFRCSSDKAGEMMIVNLDRPWAFFVLVLEKCIPVVGLGPYQINKKVRVQPKDLKNSLGTA